jgi:hypothetical protein
MKFLDKDEIIARLKDGGIRSSAHSLENARKLYGPDVYPYNERIAEKSRMHSYSPCVLLGQNWHEVKTLKDKASHIYEIEVGDIEGDELHVEISNHDIDGHGRTMLMPGIPAEFCLKNGVYTTCADGEPVYVFAEGGTGYYTKQVTRKKTSKKESGKTKSTKKTKKGTKNKSVSKKKKTTGKKSTSKKKKKTTTKKSTSKKRRTTTKKSTRKQKRTAKKKKTTKGKKKNTKGKKTRTSKH